MPFQGNHIEAEFLGLKSSVQVEARLHMQAGESSAAASSQLAEEVYGPMSGQVTSVAKQIFRRALLEADPRLVEAMFLCEISTASEALSGGSSAAFFWGICHESLTLTSWTQIDGGISSARNVRSAWAEKSQGR